MWGYWSKKKQGGSLDYTPPLDVYGSGVWGAYSCTRLLNSSYTGFACQAKDGLGNIFQIPFKNNGLIDIDFVLSTGVRLSVEIMYDQTGNGNHINSEGSGFFFTNELLNPYLIEGVNCISRGGWTKTLNGMELRNGDDKTAFMVGANQVNLSGGAIQAMGTRIGSSTGWLFRVNINQILFGLIGVSNITASVSTIIDKIDIFGFNHNSNGSVNLYRNGATLTTGSVSGGINSNDLKGGDQGSSDSSWFFEEIIWDSDQSSNALGIMTNQNNFYSAY